MARELTDEKRLELFFEMQRIRKIEETLAEVYAEQILRCPMHLSIGQEGVAVGVCKALRKEDGIMSTHRAHAHYLAKGGNLNKMIAEIYGKSSGCCGGIGGSMHLIDLSVGMLGCTPIVGGTFPVSVGVAFAKSMQKKCDITVSFFGEGMTEEGVFLEGLNFAGLKKLPILFVCENNMYSVYSPLSVRQPKERSLLKIAEGHGISAFSGDGNDVEEVFNMTTSALASIKEGNGPVLIEFSTYRWREHCGPNYDNHIGYRTEEEFQKWKQCCPVEIYRKKLLSENILTPDLFENFLGKIQNELDVAFSLAREDSFPKVSLHDQPLYAP